MQTKWLTSAAVLGLGLVLAGSPARAFESKLEERIEDHLRHDALLKDDHINVEVDGRHVRLSGRVETDAEAARAERLAVAAGARTVDDDLEVRVGDHYEHSRLKHAAKGVWRDTKHVAHATGETVGEGYVHTKLKAKIMDSRELKGSDIDVSVDNNVAYLKGRVPSEAARARAVEIARNTDGVHRVVDELVVDPASLSRDDYKERTSSVVDDASDTAITSRISARLVDEEPFRECHVNVDTVDGVVTLSGTVPTSTARERALAIADATRGVRRVIDPLSVEPVR